MGTALNYTDDIPKGLESIRYRVCAFDTYNAASDYRTGPLRAVINNTPPVIETDQDKDAGLVADGLTFTYTVSDEDEGTETLTVTEYLDGAQLRIAAAANGAERTFTITGEDWMRVSNGTHTAEIRADDGEAQASFFVTFSKLVTECAVTTSAGFQADAPIKAAALSIVGSIPSDATLTVELTNDFDAENPEAVHWEDATSAVKTGFNYVFENETTSAGCFNFRVHVEAGASGAGGYISAINGGFE